jgi:hypothetical protein
LRRKESAGVRHDWVKLFRKTLDSQVFSDAELFRLWIYLLVRANFKPSYFRGQEIARGQVAFSHRLLVDALGISKGKLDRDLKRLVAMKSITIQAGRSFTVATICNYERYQGADDEQRGANGAQVGRKRGAGGAQDGRERGANGDIHKKDKNLRREEGKKTQRAKFIPPTVDEVRAYCVERGNSVDPEHFCDHYEASGWRRSKGGEIRDWRASIRVWEKYQRDGTAPQRRNQSGDPRGNLDLLNQVLGNGSHA